MHAAVKLTAGFVALALAGAACTSPGGDAAQAATLTAFDACDELRDYFVEHALDMVGPYGLDGGHGGFPVEEPAVEEEAAEGLAEAAPTDDQAADAPVEGRDFSGTNIQEAGVDEPDHVKTDGRRLLVVEGERLHVLDVTGSTPQRIGEVDLPGHGGEALLAGDRALVVSGGHGDVIPMPEIHGGGGPQGPVTSLALVDLDGEPQVAETLRVDGGYVSARLVDGRAHLVLRTEPVGLDFTSPEGSGLRAEREATERNRQIIRDSDIDNWLPYLVRERGGEVDDGLLLDCSAVHRPDEFSGLGLAAVVTLDPADGLDPAGASAVVGSGETVYASPDNLYVATQRWADQPREGVRAGEDVTTQVHQFSLDDAPAPYVASGEVPGRLLNQWALSEYDGHLRVATTKGDPFGPWEGPEASESAVRVLRAGGGELAEVGAVTGLGEGERIYAVRYAGDLGYVVTFRETDPLYTIDLSDPTDPRVRGELKILGYSSYLHPIGDDLLLGVGQDADADGRTRGTQVSVFDVSDLADPTRLHQETIENGHSPVEHDHRALLHWPPETLTVIPVEQWYAQPVPEPVPEGEATTPPEIEPHEPFVGAIAYSVGADGITERGRITHPGGRGGAPMITRSLVVDDVLYTVSNAGVQASDLDSFDELEWIDF